MSGGWQARALDEQGGEEGGQRIDVVVRQKERAVLRRPLASIQLHPRPGPRSPQTGARRRPRCLRAASSGFHASPSLPHGLLGPCPPLSPSSPELLAISYRTYSYLSPLPLSAIKPAGDLGQSPAIRRTDPIRRAFLGTSWTRRHSPRLTIDTARLHAQYISGFA